MRVRCRPTPGKTSASAPVAGPGWTARPRLAAIAEAEFTDALCWYAERSPRPANDFDADFDRALQAIEEQPTHFPLFDDRHRFYLMRRFPDQIIYRVEKDAVTVVAVAHTSRSPGYWADR